jgi:hypothetical protein
MVPKNLNRFERLIRGFLGAFAIFAAAILFHHPAARALVFTFGLFAFWEAVAAKCPLKARMMSLPMSENVTTSERLRLLGLAAVQAVMAYEWWSAGWEKVSSPAFVVGIDQTLGFFASKNPFPWYKSFIEGFAAKNSAAFAYAVEWSQIAVALGLMLATAVILYGRDGRWRKYALTGSVLALVGGMLMNANFYLAAGWTGPGTKGSNVVMFWTQAVLLYVWVSSLVIERK